MSNKNTIPTELFRKFLKNQGLEYQGIKGSHEKWSKAGLMRPVIFQAGKKEVPIGVIRSNLPVLGLTMKEFMSIITDL